MISVVIPTRGRPDALGRTLRALAGQADAPPFEVVVADDGAGDEAAELVRRAGAHLQIRPVRVGGRGRAAARNAGALAARRPVLLFIDDDAIPAPGVLAAHAARHREASRVAVQGRVVTHPEVPRTRRARLREPLLRLDPPAGARISPLRAATNFSVRAEDLWAVGGFDEGFTGYGWEDRELAYRLDRSGVHVIWEPAAVVEHLQVDDVAAVLARRRADGRGAVRFWRKHGRPAGLAVALEIHPLMLPWKRLYYLGRLTAAAFGALHRAAAARGWDLLAGEAANHLTWAAYYRGVFEALREPEAGEPEPLRAAGGAGNGEVA